MYDEVVIYNDENALMNIKSKFLTFNNSFQIYKVGNYKKIKNKYSL